MKSPITWDTRRAWFVKHMPWGSEDETLVVLKGHLLVEAVLREYATASLKRPAALLDDSTMFKTVLNICKAVAEPGEEWAWSLASALNSLRNELAHRIESPKLDETRRVFLSVARQDEIVRSDDSYRSATSDLVRTKIAIMYLFTDIAGLVEERQRA